MSDTRHKSYALLEVFQCLRFLFFFYATDSAAHAAKTMALLIRHRFSIAHLCRCFSSGAWTRACSVQVALFFAFHKCLFSNHPIVHYLFPCVPAYTCVYSLPPHSHASRPVLRFNRAASPHPILHWAVIYIFWRSRLSHKTPPPLPNAGWEPTAEEGFL